MKKIVFSNDDIEKIKYMYNSLKMTQNKIAEIFNVSQPVISRLFIDNNIPTRDKSYYRKYSLNENYFDNIDSDVKAYFLGLLYADGNVGKNNYSISLELQESDKNILESFNSHINSNRPLTFRKFNVGNDSYKLMIDCEHMHKVLAEKYGLIPNKSLCLNFPNNIDDEFVFSMLRGYIDGDGWIQKYRIGFMSSKSFCEGVQAFLLKYGIHSTIRNQNPKKYNSNTKVLDITNKKNIIPLVNLMFKKGNICLNRKYNRYIKYNFLNINNSLTA